MEVTQEEIRSITRFLFLLKKDNRQICDAINEVYGDASVSIRSIERYVKSIEEGTFTIFDRIHTGRPKNSKYIEDVKNYMDENPYSSARECSEELGIDKKTVSTILKEELNMHKINFKWVPFELTNILKEKRVQIATKLLNFLSSCDRKKLNKVYTQDETWVLYENPRNSMWIEYGSEIPQRVRPKISSKKVMISVIWSRTGIQSITMLPPNEKFNKQFFIQGVLEDFSQKVSTRGKFFHCDNARPHLANEKLDELGLQRLEHPPYSQDLAPSDFFLFGLLKKLLEGKRFDDEDELFEEVSNILYSIPKEYFSRAFDEWMNRLQEVINTQGEYI